MIISPLTAVIQVTKLHMTGLIFGEISNFPPFFLKGSILHICLAHLSPETMTLTKKVVSPIYTYLFFTKCQKPEMSISFQVQQFIAHK